jgi:heme/copper-type cytochrome/quinol oxidase subunit 4
MPRGTVRGYITILIVAFPFNFLLVNKEIPGLIINVIFVAVAFYFETRRGQKELEVRKVVHEVKNPIEVHNELKKQKKPLYLPKYTVRTILFIMLIIILVWNILGPQFPFRASETLINLVLIIAVFSIGSFLRYFGFLSRDKKIRKLIEEIPNHETLSEEELFTEIMDRQEEWWRDISKSILSYVTLIAVLLALGAYTLNWDFIIAEFSFYTFSLREILLLVINAYYGFRD